MGLHTNPTFQERYCHLCNEKYMPTGGAQKYCSRCQKIMLKEYERRNFKRRVKRKRDKKLLDRRETRRIFLENLLPALDPKPGETIQVSIAHNEITVTRLPTSQANS